MASWIGVPVVVKALAAERTGGVSLGPAPRPIKRPVRNSGRREMAGEGRSAQEMPTAEFATP